MCMWISLHGDVFGWWTSPPGEPVLSHASLIGPSSLSSRTWELVDLCSEWCEIRWSAMENCRIFIRYLWSWLNWILRMVWTNSWKRLKRYWHKNPPRKRRQRSSNVRSLNGWIWSMIRWKNCVPWCAMYSPKKENRMNMDEPYINGWEFLLPTVHQLLFRRLSFSGRWVSPTTVL